MGQRMPPVPHIYGNNCLSLFPAGKTPKYMYVRFSGIIKEPGLPPWWHGIPPNDRAFKLTQDDVNPCKWEITTGEWHVFLILQVPPITFILWLENWPDASVFFWDQLALPIDEGCVYNNQLLNAGIGNPVHDGIATVTWIHEATALLESINMERADDLFMELRPLVDGNKVYKFCRRKDATNISIEFEPE